MAAHQQRAVFPGPLATARRRLRLGRALRHMSRVEAAWLTGDINEAQVALLAAARTPAGSRP